MMRLGGAPRTQSFLCSDLYDVAFDLEMIKQRANSWKDDVYTYGETVRAAGKVNRADGVVFREAGEVGLLDYEPETSSNSNNFIVCIEDLHYSDLNSINLRGYYIVTSSRREKSQPRRGPSIVQCNEQ